ncbi:sulfatase-like hydrolase/transferase [Caldalkalibacillus salinus]|uniref:sulfatase-like hydrolase/transferase n=1 Tax=Caldalkalibacillus salinus TaxID=2803787 RepID=UPI00192380DC
MALILINNVIKAGKNIFQAVFNREKLVPLLILSFVLAKLMVVEYTMIGYIHIMSLKTTIGITLILLSLVYIFKNKNVYRYMMALNVVTSLLLLAHLLYYRYFGIPISLFVLLQGSNLSGLGPSILHLLQTIDFLLFIDIFVLIPLFMKIKGPISPPNYKVGITFLCLGALIASIVPLLTAVFIGPSDVIKRYNGSTFVIKYGIIGHHIADTVNVMYEMRRINLTDEDRSRIEAWFDHKDRLYGPRNTNHKYHGLSDDKNLILIQIESLQNFVLDLEVDGHVITPNLNRMLKNSLYYPNIYAQTVEGNSSDAELLVNTSTFPLRQGATFFRYPDTHYFSLGKALKNKGYNEAFALHGDYGDFWNRDIVYPYLDFDHFYDMSFFEMDEFIGMGLSDDSFFRQSIPYIKDKEHPFYAYYTTLTSHTPFIIPDEYKTLDLQGEISDTHLGRYLESVHYADNALGYFVKQLEAMGLLENSLVVIYGDHKGVFREHIPEIEAHLGDSNIDNEKWLRRYEPIPFIIFNPQYEGEVFETIGGQVDVMPTLLSLLGLDEDKYYHQTMGVDLFSLDEEHGFALIPSGGYNQQAIVTYDQVHPTFDKEANEILDIAELIIRGNYHK